MKKILVPIDFSENTTLTINAACDISRKLHCDIILLHSYFDRAVLQSINLSSTSVVDDIIPVIDPGLTMLREACEEEMKDMEQKIRKAHPGINIQSEVTPLNLKEVIDEICQKNDVIMIVIGATGSGKKDSFSGSVASSLFDCSPVPVLAIPDGYMYSGNHFGNILYATNFSEAGQAEVRFILDNFMLDIDVLYCCHLRFPDRDDLLDEAQMQILSEPFEKEVRSGKVSFEIIDANDIDQTLENLVKEYGIKLISFHEYNISFFRRLFYKSVDKKNMYRFNVPLLVFRKFED